MYTLTYNGKSESFTSVEDLKIIREKFHIPKRKNLYRIREDGQLQKVESKNIKRILKNNDHLEALSDFTLG
jgi:hypothetical protein